MKFISTILLIFSMNLAFGQDTSSIEQKEKKLETLLSDLRKAKDNTEKEEKNRDFKKELEKVLEDPEAFSYHFPLLTTVGFIDSPDKQMRIVNWNVEQDDFSHKYFCFVMHFNKRKKEYVVTELKDNSFGMPSQPSGIIGSDEWYGALYYRIIPVKKGGKTLYTVLGWDHNSSMSQMKLIDVIYFTGNSVKLGSPVFKVGDEIKKRVFFEHSKKATMYLNYEEDRKRIMMDHLAPETPSMKNFRSYYVPDLSYDAFVFEGNKWVLKEDVIGVNKDDGQSKKVVYVRDEKSGKVEELTIKDKWVNPEDKNAPAGGSEHVAVTPESAAEKTRGAEKETSGYPTVNKKDKRDPSQLNTISSGGKKRKKRK